MAEEFPVSWGSLSDDGDATWSSTNEYTNGDANSEKNMVANSYRTEDNHRKESPEEKGGEVVTSTADKSVGTEDLELLKV